MEGIPMDETTMDAEAQPGPLDGCADENGGLFPDGMEFDENAACFRLGEYRDDDLLTKVGMGQVFKCSFRTLQRMVERFEIPPATPFAGRSVWIVGRLKAWVANVAEAREAEALKQAKKMYRL